MRVNDIMSAPVVTVPQRAYLDEAARTMLANRIGCVVVVDDDGQATGVLTERDFTARDAGNPFDPHRAPSLFGKNVRQNGLAQIYEDARSMTVGKGIRPIVHSLSPDDQVERAMDLMVRHDVNPLPVLDAGRAVGIVSRHDLLRLIFSASPKRPATPVSVTA